MGIGPWRGQASLAGKLRYFIRRYPIATAGTTFAFTALAAIGAMMGYRALTKDVNPAYAELNTLSGFFEVYNRGNDLLWKRLVPGVDSALEQQNISGSPKYALFDFNGDDRREVITTLQLSGQPVVPPRGLHIFDGRGRFEDIDFSRRISYLGNPYEVPVIIEGGSMFVIDSTNPSDPEILITAKNDRSPNALIRIDRHGIILGEYWHHGQFRGLSQEDLDGDGATELLLWGSNDVREPAGLSEPVVVVLNPRKIRGKTESGSSRGYGYAMSDAELYYINLPLTDLNIRYQRNAGVDRIRIYDDRIIVQWRFRHTDEQIYGLDFIFTRSFTPVGTKSTTQFQDLFNREHSAGRLPKPLNDAYLRTLTSGIRFWDGREWSNAPVKIGIARDIQTPK